MFIHSGPWCLWPISWKPFDFRAVRWSAVWAWIVVATLFQTCFRPPKMNAWCWWIRVCFWALRSCPNQNAVEDMGAAWCVSTNLSIYLSIYLSQSICFLTLCRYLFNRWIYINMGAIHYCATNHFWSAWIQYAIRNAELRPQWQPNYTGFCKLSNLYVMAQRYRKMIWWMRCATTSLGPSCF